MQNAKFEMQEVLFERDSMKRLVFVAVAAAVVVATTHVRAMIPEQVKIDSGMVAGTASGQPTVRVFKGIPFAAPPLAENRWKAPQPVAKWDGVRKADAFGAPCTSGPAAFGRCGRGRTRARGSARSSARSSGARSSGTGSCTCSRGTTGAGCATARAGAQRRLSVSQCLDEREQPERQATGDGVDLRRRFHGRLRRSRMV